MADRRGQSARMPATKLPHLQKQMQKRKETPVPPRKADRKGQRRTGSN